MIPIVSIGLVATGVLWFALLLWRFPAQIALLTLAVIALLDSMQLSVVEINAGVSIYQDDIGCLVLVIAAWIISRRNGKLRSMLCTPVLILLGLSILNFLRGVLSFGPRPAGN